MLVITRGYIIGSLGIGTIGTLQIARLRPYKVIHRANLVVYQWCVAHLGQWLTFKKHDGGTHHIWHSDTFSGFWGTWAKNHEKLTALPAIILLVWEENGRPEWFAQMISWLAQWFGGLVPNHGHLRKKNSFGLMGKISMTCWVHWREHLEFASFSILHQRMWSLLKNHQQSRGKLHRSSGFRRHCKWMMLHAETLMINTGPSQLKSWFKWFKNVSSCICRYPPLSTANETETNYYRPT